MNMREIQKLQQKIMKMQEELEQSKFSGSAGGGAVTLMMTGKYEITDVKIDPEAFSADEIEELEVMVKAAAKDAFDKVSAAQEKIATNMTGGMKIPGLM
jgi:DNA-binding YbaB/EbfC family protein